MMNLPSSSINTSLGNSPSASDGKAAVVPLELAFPSYELWEIAKRESWRKEIYRPIYHIHKWWATRLGSIFRAILLGVLAKEDEDIWTAFYRKCNFADRIVLDPFMGSGTTIGEALKLGARAIGCDVNPISSFMVQHSLTRVAKDDLDRAFSELRTKVAPQILKYYKTKDPASGDLIDVLYYFWVKEVESPSGERIPLFSDYVFSKDAYPERKPLARILCPSCGAINSGRYDSTEVHCGQCQIPFNPQQGPAQGQFVTDSQGTRFRIKDLITSRAGPPNHRMYAILAVRPNGEKIYLSPTYFDLDLYQQASDQLSKEELPIPKLNVRPGHNTNQARGYNYLQWREFFNDRQLLGLGRLLKEILNLQDTAVRDQFLCLFSSALEFNNLFCSFKGEGTGAVRHMFSHHILKPERVPLENNVWGTAFSSGAFSTLYESRLLPAKGYLDAPFELAFDTDLLSETGRTRKIVCSAPIDTKVVRTWEEFAHDRKATLVLNGDSGKLLVPDESVDAVVTDPPYFDFVHYSELSDFFYAWLSPVLKDRYSFFGRSDSSHDGEVQDADPFAFSENLSKVFLECRRVLKPLGALVFTFHHSHPDGWLAVYRAIRSAGLLVSATHVIHAELSISKPKNQTKEPISLDAIVVCRRSDFCMAQAAINESAHRSHGLEISSTLSQGDRFVVAAAGILREASAKGLSETDVEELLRNAHDRSIQVASSTSIHLPQATT